MKKSNLLALGVFLLSSFAFAQSSITCKQAMEKEIKNWGGSFAVQTTAIVPVGSEPFVEASSLVLVWSKNSETRTEHYILVSATCEVASDGNSTDLARMKLWTDMSPSEGGVTVKLVTKARY